MFLDLEIKFNENNRIYNPGDTTTCEIYVTSTFRMHCKYITLRLRCPYTKKGPEYFRKYETAKSAVNLKLAENFELQRGVNRFIASCKIPNTVTEDIFESKFHSLRLKICVQKCVFNRISQWNKMQP